MLTKRTLKLMGYKSLPLDTMEDTTLIMAYGPDNSALLPIMREAESTAYGLWAFGERDELADAARKSGAIKPAEAIELMNSEYVILDFRDTSNKYQVVKSAIHIADVSNEVGSDELQTLIGFPLFSDTSIGDIYQIDGNMMGFINRNKDNPPNDGAALLIEIYENIDPKYGWLALEF